MPASIKDVAREAGVSIATVSRVLNEVDVVNEDTKKKVVDAIKKLGYRPNIIARSLKTQKTKTIGIVIPDISRSVYPDIVRGAEDVANIYNYNIILCNSDLDMEKEKEYLRVLREKMVDGMLYMSVSLSDEIVDLAKELNIPTVLVDAGSNVDIFPSVNIDNVQAGYDMTNYLISKGKKQIAYFGASPEVVSGAALRYQGYEKALKENGLSIDKKLIQFGNLNAKDAKKYVEKLEKAKALDKADAIFCVSDELAMGVIGELRERNMNVPEDISVVGFNNNYHASIFYPKVTTISEPTYDMGSVAMRMLIKKINKKPLDSEHFILPHNLIERDSCK